MSKTNTETINVEEQEVNQTTNGIKLLDSEIKLISDLGNRQRAVANELGAIAQQQISLDIRQEQAEDAFRSNLELEKQIANQLTEKYGNGTLNLQDGVFIPSQGLD